MGNERESGDLPPSRQELACADSVLQLIEHLVSVDPPKDTPLGRLLIGLTESMREWEKSRCPLPEQAQEFEAFRKGRR